MHVQVTHKGSYRNNQRKIQTHECPAPWNWGGLARLEQEERGDGIQSSLCVPGTGVHGHRNGCPGPHPHGACIPAKCPPDIGEFTPFESSSLRAPAALPWAAPCSARPCCSHRFSAESTVPHLPVPGARHAASSPFPAPGGLPSLTPRQALPPSFLYFPFASGS